jgi:hypothetical protein
MSKCRLATLAQGRPGSLNGLLPGFAGPFTARALLTLVFAAPAGVGIRFGRKRCFSRSVPCSRIGLSLIGGDPVTSSRSLPPSRC